jgi:hypothetical protein
MKALFCFRRRSQRRQRQEKSATWALYPGNPESEHQVSPGVASCRLHPAFAAHCRQANCFRTQAFIQRLSVFRATLSVVAAQILSRFLCGFDNREKQYNQKINFVHGIRARLS